MKYKRVLLKLSGEALAGDKQTGIDFEKVFEFGIKSKHAISWVDAMGEKLKQKKDMVIAIASEGKGAVLQSKEIDGINYYIVFCGEKKTDVWNEVLNSFNPDIIHTYGTEQKQSYDLINNYVDKYPIIISLQGIITEYSKHYIRFIICSCHLI